MPRYFIDTDDEAFAVHDDEGQIFRDLSAARDIAHRVLPEMVRQKRPNDDGHTFTASVRDESGTVVYVATLAFAGEWKVPRPTR
ncbi:DUF6894 family protein [Methylobacterium planeticum]|uniref:DUF6894 domain-containing protein n=1 Tax=Methylobacterium planeticum TaxID=2615211 RepID=A0A6N6ML56_9HYPH|nr:hypothetical protein [Methylobacterium planeticum]KAB1069875.1 hypothetical protein F6X51_24465 [Methylobacterium planeticum]